MKNSENVTIGMLVISAAVLLAMVAVTVWLPSPAGAASASVSRGDYVVATGAWSGSMDLLYIIDVRAQRLNVYWINDNADAIEQQDTVDLRRLFAD
jgi:hypothetical protein